MAIGGTAGALLGAASSTVLVKLGNQLADLFGGRLTDVIALARQVVDSDDTFLEKVRNLRLAPLILKASAIASMTTQELHVRMLAAVLRDGIREDLTISEAEKLITAIDGLTAEAVLVLQALASPAIQVADCTDQKMADRLGISGAKAGAAFLVLQRVEAVEPIPSAWGGNEGWTIGAFGPRILRLIEEAGEAVD